VGCDIFDLLGEFGSQTRFPLGCRVLPSGKATTVLRRAPARMGAFVDSGVGGKDRLGNRTRRDSLPIVRTHKIDKRRFIGSSRRGPRHNVLATRSQLFLTGRTRTKAHSVALHYRLLSEIIGQIPFNWREYEENRRYIRAMTNGTGRLLCFLSCLPVFGQSAQTLLIPQVVDGGGWQTAFVLTNRTANPASASLSFRVDTTAGATQAWTPPFLEVSSTTGLALSAGSTMYLHTPGTAASLSQGWAVVNADAGIVAYAIFTFRHPGRQDQDGTAIAAVSSTRILVPFDNSSGHVTSIGVVNPAGTSQSISVNFRIANGTVSQGSLPSIPPSGHMAFLLSQQFPAIAGQSGLAEFYSTSGSFSLLALRANQTGAFTAAPVYFRFSPSDRRH